MGRYGTVIQGFDLLDVVHHIISTNKKFQATFLSQTEEIITDNDEYYKLRKLYLDSSNNFVRSVIKDMFGDVEV